jgi:hypothetical protein
MAGSKTSIQIDQAIRDELRSLSWNYTSRLAKRITQADIIRVAIKLINECPERMEELLNEDPTD